VTPASGAIACTVRPARPTRCYDHQESRDHLLALAQQNPKDHWADVTRDGEVTLDEFRSLVSIQNAVNTHAGEVIGSIESQMAFDKAFAE